MNCRRMISIVLSLALVVIIAAGVFLFQWWFVRSDSNDMIGQFLRSPEANRNLETGVFTQCPGAPFIIPSEGFIGLLWRDDAAPYTPLHRHTGIDIFAGIPEGEAPIYAVYDGWLTRLDDWKSTVIIRHNDPLQEGRTIWTYYTHMASRSGVSYIVDDYPQGTYGVPIRQGTLIGYQGAYSPQYPVAVHLHLSIVTSEPDGSFRNEAVLENTLNPSPYFGMDVNADSNTARPVQCLQDRE